MTASRIAALASAAALALAAGCGGDDDDNGGGGGATTGGGQAAQPQQVFADTCGGCHTLSAAGTNGQVGPNLDELKPDVATVERAIEQGPSVMPSGLLKGAEARAVAEYVAQNAGR
jgi:mono/diheme cytochrome c family protein